MGETRFIGQPTVFALRPVVVSIVCRYQPKAAGQRTLGQLPRLVAFSASSLSAVWLRLAAKKAKR